MMNAAVRFRIALFAALMALEVVNRKLEEEAGVGKTELGILQFLGSNTETRRMKDIGQGLGVKLSNLTNLIDNLEEAKLVRRTNSKEDRRAVIIEVTEKGQALLEKLNGAFDSHILMVQDQMGVDCVDNSAQILESLVVAMEVA